jgi:hypothetical protein
MYQYKTGYSPGEQAAAHSRRRYRLLPSKFTNSTGPTPDLGLWIIHYGPSEHNDRVPSNLIPIDLRMQNIMNTRAYLHSQGQIVQKEFMLHDRSNWPQIAFPRNQPRGPPMYGANVPPTRIPQSMAYPAQHPTAGPPAKRVRTQANANQNVAVSSTVAVLDADDEEDTSRGDLFDHTTPREISMSRYKQNHEWMEEILSSPYSMNQIIPADLGLGVRGELGSLTEGIFDAPLDPEKDITKYNYVGLLDPEKASEFRKRAQERNEKTQKEIEKMKAKHAKRLAKFQKGSLVSLAEKDLRTAVENPSDTGPEYWRLEGKVDSEDDFENGKTVIRLPSKVDDILAQVEASLNKHATAVQELRRIQDGGYEEAPAIPTPPQAPSPPQITPPGSHNGSQHSGVLIGDADIDMSNSAAGLLDQFHTGLSSIATPGSNFPTPQAHLPGGSLTGTPNMHAPSPLLELAETGMPELHQIQQAPDVNMAHAGTSIEQVASTDASGTGDWVVVPPGGISPAPSGSAQAQPEHPTTTAPEPLPVTSASEASNLTPAAAVTSEHTYTNPTTQTNTPLPDFHTSPDDFGDLGDLDSAGEALANYDPDEMDDGMGGDHEDMGGDMGDLGLDLNDADMGMDDSAFGEAFHGVEPREGEDGNGDVM